MLEFAKHISPMIPSPTWSLKLVSLRSSFLKSEAVPTLGLPQLRKELPALLPSQPGDFRRQSEPKATREMACQTDPIISRYACVQVNVKPSRWSKGLQVQTPHKSDSVSCDTGTFMEIPLPESPRATSTPLERKRCEVSASDPSFHLNDSSLNFSRNVQAALVVV